MTSAKLALEGTLLLRQCRDLQHVAAFPSVEGQAERAAKVVNLPTEQLDQRKCLLRPASHTRNTWRNPLLLQVVVFPLVC